MADPQEGGKLRNTKPKSILRRPLMLRSQTVLSIRNVHDEGKSVQEIAQELRDLASLTLPYRRGHRASNLSVLNEREG